MNAIQMTYDNVSKSKIALVRKEAAPVNTKSEKITAVQPSTQAVINNSFTHYDFVGVAG